MKSYYALSQNYTLRLGSRYGKNSLKTAIKVEVIETIFDAVSVKSLMPFDFEMSTDSDKDTNLEVGIRI